MAPLTNVVGVVFILSLLRAFGLNYSEFPNGCRLKSKTFYAALVVCKRAKARRKRQYKKVQLFSCITLLF